MFSSYKTLQHPIENVLFKEKGSKFLGYAYPVLNETEVKERIEGLWKEHHQATHVCYAFQIGKSEVYYRANDDGEPKNSAGMPIYGQIQAFELHEVLVAVVRYFGGTKLGVGGLITAYREAARLTLEEGILVEKILASYFLLSFPYELLNKVMTVIKQRNIGIVAQQMQEDVQLTIEVRKDLAEETFVFFQQLYPLHIKVVE